MIKMLFVIDMQNDFITGSLGTPEAQAVLPKVEQKIKDLIDGDTYVFFTRDTHDENYLNTHEGKVLPIKHCVKEEKGWEIPTSLTQYFPTPIVFDKPAFGSVDLVNIIPQIITELYPDEEEIADDYDKDLQIELVGLCTGICVLSNAIMLRSCYPEAEIIVDSSCCACVSPESHERALETMKLCHITIK
jgi:nicotinamidase-related amidase